MVHLITGETITKYKVLATDPATNKLWTRGMNKEIGCLAQVYMDIKGMNTVKYTTHAEICTILKDRTVAYT